ncbi:hypothetical protein [Eikenella corrodens]|jgi:hypothetical protein|uniref:hypothetical protein n=1 Tax=Eikenella corrodens TaxID=539 RepID=UPI00129B9AF0|nr:hypothetical protein [Eikenella corrodens]
MTIGWDIAAQRQRLPEREKGNEMTELAWIAEARAYIGMHERDAACFLSEALLLPKIMLVKSTKILYSSRS